jgi:hypothetical protein
MKKFVSIIQMILMFLTIGVIFFTPIVLNDIFNYRFYYIGTIVLLLIIINLLDFLKRNKL